VREKNGGWGEEKPEGVPEKEKEKRKASIDRCLYYKRRRKNRRKGFPAKKCPSLGKAAPAKERSGRKTQRAFNQRFVSIWRKQCLPLHGKEPS